MGRMVNKVHRRAAKAAIKEFSTCTYIQKLARDRKSKIDQLLKEYKKENTDFRYIVRNGERDLWVMIKRISKGNFLPYRNISLEVLGRLSPLKPKTIDAKETVQEEVDPEESEDFRKQRRERNNSFVPKDQIFRNITA